MIHIAQFYLPNPPVYNPKGIPECDMGCCFSEPVDFNSEVSLYHFDLHWVIETGAFC